MKEKPLNKVYIDFDNTLCKTTFNSNTGHYDMGQSYEAVADAVANQHFQGREIMIFTARPKKEWGEVREWLDREGIPYKKVTNKKKPGLYYVDDRAMRPDEFLIFNRVEHLPPEPLDDGKYDSNGERI